MEKRKNKGIIIFLFLLPALLLFFGILVVPIFASLHHSFFEYKSFESSGAFVGFDNYKNLFTSQYDFGTAIKNAMILAALSVFIQLPLSLGLALMLGKGIKGERFYLSVYFMPVLISAVVIGMLWEKIYNPIYGLIFKSFEAFGWSDILPPEGLLGNRKTALLAVFIPTDHDRALGSCGGGGNPTNSFAIKESPFSNHMGYGGSGASTLYNKTIVSSNSTQIRSDYLRKANSIIENKWLDMETFEQYYQIALDHYSSDLQVGSKVNYGVINFSLIENNDIGANANLSISKYFEEKVTFFNKFLKDNNITL